ncbi:MAG TPA: hypothetical protein VFA46_08825 [Actinomycetes bacterium]|jgi:hypothetical protein|nr:hypothetical protein [Actinomycetes bacterium]
MADPMLVRRLAVDLRNLSNKTLSLRGAVEDYRHDLVRSTGDAGAHDDTELLAFQRKIQTLWEAMDRVEGSLRAATPRSSLLLWLE